MASVRCPPPLILLHTCFAFNTPSLPPPPRAPDRRAWAGASAVCAPSGEGHTCAGAGQCFCPPPPPRPHAMQGVVLWDLTPFHWPIIPPMSPPLIPNVTVRWHLTSLRQKTSADAALSFADGGVASLPIKSQHSKFITTRLVYFWARPRGPSSPSPPHATHLSFFPPSTTPL